MLMIYMLLNLTEAYIYIQSLHLTKDWRITEILEKRFQSWHG